ncbi:MAG: NYN domain-containing protein [Candidatus Microgenomates bacterium]
MTTYCFVDASNLFYGGEKSLGWKIDYQKLLKYLKNKYKISKAYYYAGVELCGFPYSVLNDKNIDLKQLLKFLIKNKNQNEKIIQRVKFYLKLKSFGYLLNLKPVKIFKDGNRLVKKANCDVDLTFDLMRYFNKYNNVLILSGDGDFAIVLKYLIKKGKKVTILSRGERTAKEIKQLAGKNFKDFNYLRELIRFNK